MRLRSNTELLSFTSFNGETLWLLSISSRVGGIFLSRAVKGEGREGWRGEGMDRQTDRLNECITSFYSHLLLSLGEDIDVCTEKGKNQFVSVSSPLNHNAD